MKRVKHRRSKIIFAAKIWVRLDLGELLKDNAAEHYPPSQRLLEGGQPDPVGPYREKPVELPHLIESKNALHLLPTLSVRELKNE